MIQVHLFDTRSSTLMDINTFCGEKAERHGYDALQARNPLNAPNLINYCQKCKESEEYALWCLGNL